jgi:hypothetical protein
MDRIRLIVLLNSLGSFRQLKKLTVLFLFLSSLCQAQSNWSQLGSAALESADIRSYLWHNSLLFAGGRGGLYKSSDKGLQWSWSGKGLALANAAEVNALAVVNDTLFAATPYGLARSGDMGASWVACADAAGLRQYIDVVYSLGNAVVVSSRNSIGEWRIYRSVDYGRSWSSGGHVFPNRPQIYKARAGMLLVMQADSFYTSSDALGFTYFPVSFPSFIAPNPIVESLTGDSDHVFAVVNYSRVLRLDLNSGIWDDSADINYAPRPQELYSLSYFNGQLMVAGISYSPYFTPAVYVSYNNGYDWDKAQPSGLSYPMMQKLQWLGGGELVGSFYYGNYYSSDSGQSWSRRSQGLYASQSSNTISAGDVLLSVSPARGVIRSADQGAGWNNSNKGIDSPDVFVSGLMYTTKAVYANLQFYPGDSSRLYSSADKGLNWARCQLPAVYQVEMIGSNDSLLFIKSGSLLYRTDDGGSSFQQLTQPAELGSSGSLQSITGARDTILAMGKDSAGKSRLFISTDNGGNFLAVQKGIYSEVKKIFRGTYCFLALTNNPYDTLKQLQPSGWIKTKGLDLPAQLVMYTSDQCGNRIFALTNNGLYVTDSWGYRWVPAGPLPREGLSISGFINTGSHVFFHTQQHGIWRNSITVGERKVQAADTKGWLVYPNPSSGQVQFRHHTFNTADISLFDLQGQCIFKSKAEGALDIILKPGLYLYRIADEAGCSYGRLLVTAQ